MDALIRYLVENAAHIQFGNSGLHRDEADYKLHEINAALNQAMHLKQAASGQPTSFTQMYFEQLRKDFNNASHEYFLERMNQENQPLSDEQLRLLARVYAEIPYGLVRHNALAIGVSNDVNTSPNVSFVDYAVNAILNRYPRDRQSQSTLIQELSNIACDYSAMTAGLRSGLKHLTRLIELIEQNGWKKADKLIADRLMAMINGRP